VQALARLAREKDAHAHRARLSKEAREIPRSEKAAAAASIGEHADNKPPRHAAVNRAARVSDPTPPQTCRERVGARHAPRHTIAVHCSCAHLTHFASESRRFLIPTLTRDAPLTFPRMLHASWRPSPASLAFKNFPARSRERERRKKHRPKRRRIFAECSPIVLHSRRLTSIRKVKVSDVSIAGKNLRRDECQ